jgi:hypothetical protein
MTVAVGVSALREMASEVGPWLLGVLVVMLVVVVVERHDAECGQCTGSWAVGQGKGQRWC